MMNQREAHSDVSAQAIYAASDSTKTLIAGVANMTIYVQRLVYVPFTVAAQAITVKDSTGTPVIIALIPASQSTPYEINYAVDPSERGFGLTEGKDLLVTSTAGPAGSFVVTAYLKKTALTAA